MSCFRHDNQLVEASEKLPETAWSNYFIHVCYAYRSNGVDMKKEAPKINALISLIAKYHPSNLKELRQRYPQYAETLRGGTQLGNEEFKITPWKDFGIDIALIGLRTAIERFEPNFDRLRQRLALLKKLRLVASIASLGSIPVLFTTLAPEMGKLATISAIITLFGGVILQFASYLETPDYGGKKNFAELYEEFSNIYVEATKIELKLKLFKEQIESGQRQNENDEDIVELVKLANKVAADLNWAEIQLGRKTFRSKDKYIK
jgi:hypothetical protein